MPAAMHRRRFASFVASLAVAQRLLAADEPPRPSHRISAATLHAALAARFPVVFGARGLLEVEVGAPRLLLLPARNKLGATLQALASSRGRAAAPAGELDLVFSLRYEPADQTLRAHDPEVLEVRLPDVPSERGAALQQLLSRAAKDSLAEVVLHRLTPRELALPQAMGVEPRTLTVVDNGVVVTFAPAATR